MTKNLVLCLFLHMGVTNGWGGYPRIGLGRAGFPSSVSTESLVPMASAVSMESSTGGSYGIPQPPEMEQYDDPCWQNFLDDDCSMGNIYAANFVASEWIKSMPCGKGIEVRSDPLRVAAVLSSPCVCAHLFALSKEPSTFLPCALLGSQCLTGL
jgi:hypothetical protein